MSRDLTQELDDLRGVVAAHAQEIVNLRAMINGRDRGLKMEVRQARLMEVDSLERDVGIEPRTAELRKVAKGRG